MVSTETDDSTTPTVTVVSNSTNNTTNDDDVIEEDDGLDPVQVEDDNDNALDPDNEDPTHLPNNVFCFTDDDFLESVTNMINVTRHCSKWCDT
mmetsp:Transcript_2306/g.2447  ORF Transcript_2306/g.2447 Transcript_2306/m.2447 type:complete len:93 (-) Transcript_2306:1483-1761(-)